MIDAFRKAGLDPDKPPKTWLEVAEYSKKLVAAGYGASLLQQESFSTYEELNNHDEGEIKSHNTYLTANARVDDNLSVEASVTYAYRDNDSSFSSGLISLTRLKRAPPGHLNRQR